MAQASEALRQVQSRQMGRREFLKDAGAAGASAFVFGKFGGVARAAEVLFGESDYQTYRRLWNTETSYGSALPDLGGRREALDTSVREYITDPTVVAGLYGWRDDVISKDARFWHQTPTVNGFWDGGWVFDSTISFTDSNGNLVQGDGKPHGIWVQGSDPNRGAEATGFLKIPVPGGNFVGRFAAHRNAGVVEAIRATLYPHKNADDGWINLADGIRNTRQPGEIWLPINEAPGITNAGEIPLSAMSQQDAARILGVPGTWGGDPNNWIAVDNGPQGDRYVALKRNPDGSNTGIRLLSPEGLNWPDQNGTVWPVAQGSIVKVGIQNSLFVAHPIVREIFGNEMTVRFTTNPSALWRNSMSAMNDLGASLKQNVLPITR